MEHTMFKKSLTAGAAALALAGTIVASTGSAEAAFGRRTAFFTGLAVGAVVAGGVHAYHAPRYYGGGCVLRTRKVFDPYYGWVWRTVRICY
jgi:hypothetical protein